MNTREKQIHVLGPLLSTGKAGLEKIKPAIDEDIDTMTLDYGSDSGLWCLQEHLWYLFYGFYILQAFPLEVKKFKPYMDVIHCLIF